METSEEIKMMQMIESISSYTEEISEADHKIKEKINEVSDFVSIYSSRFIGDAVRLEQINEILQSYTWVSSEEVTEEYLKIVTSLSNHCRSMIKSYKHLFGGVTESYKTGPFILIHGITDEILPVIEQIEEMEENLEDLHQIFFVLPHDKEFQELNKMLKDC